MKTNQKRTLFLLAVMLVAMITTSCKKDNEVEAPLLALTSISPESGPKATIVTIEGSAFGTDINTTQVFFNEVEAVVQTVNEKQITAVVPARAFTGLVKVISDGKELIGPEFTYVISDVQVSTLAGGEKGFLDESVLNAKFNTLYSMCVDAQGNIYVADFFNEKIRKIVIGSGGGVVSTLAGSTAGFSEGNGDEAKFNQPRGIAIDTDGNIYVADSDNDRIRKITANGDVTTLAGLTKGFSDGIGSDARFNSPGDIATDLQGNVYVVDGGNHKIRKITPSGDVTTLAGSTKGFADATGADAQFHFPEGIAVDKEGNVYVADKGNHKIRKITPDGAVTTLAGTTKGFMEGAGDVAQFDTPFKIAVDTNGNVYVTDYFNNKIRKITQSGEVSTLAGSTKGFADGIGSTAQFSAPRGVAVNASGDVLVGDAGNYRLRKITQE